MSQLNQRGMFWNMSLAGGSEESTVHEHPECNTQTCMHACTHTRTRAHTHTRARAHTHTYCTYSTYIPAYRHISLSGSKAVPFQLLQVSVLQQNRLGLYNPTSIPTSIQTGPHFQYIMIPTSIHTLVPISILALCSLANLVLAKVYLHSLLRSQCHCWDKTTFYLKISKCNGVSKCVAHDDTVGRA